MSKIQWHKIADAVTEINFPPHQLTVVEVDGKKITIAKHQDQLYACAHKCPHASGVMANGFLDAVGNIVCPLHRYKFALSNGRNTSGEGYFLKTYPVEIRPDGVFIGFEQKNWLGF